MIPDIRVKGCRNANAGLAGASGLQHLIANHEQLLADTVYRQFEIPLLEALDDYKLVTADRLAAYEKSLHLQSGVIRKTEAENMKNARRRKRGEFPNRPPRSPCADLKICSLSGKHCTSFKDKLTSWMP